jgi:type VI secretion system protein VasD
MRLRRRLALAAPLALGGCSLFGSSDTELELSIRAGERINVNELEQPSPVVLRIYELRTTEGFLAADFFDLYDREQTRLGTELLGRREVTLIPGRTVTQDRRKLAEETRHLGALAAFRDLDGAEWRVAAPIRQGRVNRLSLVAEGRGIAFRDPS